jgi:hypothetical protein
MSTSRITIGSGPGQTTLTVGVITDGQLTRRNGTSFEGVDASAVTTGQASGLTETSGPTALTMGEVADTEVLTRSGTTIDGVLPSAMTVGVATYANGVRETSGPTTLTMGAVADAEVLTRSGTTIDGVSLASIAASLRAIDFALTPVPDATKSWDTAELNLAITHDAALCAVTLPDATQVTNWVPATAPRRVFTMNAGAFGWSLVAPADVKINGGPLGTDMSPVPDSNRAPSPTALGQWVYVHRASATEFWVWGGE